VSPAELTDCSAAHFGAGATDAGTYVARAGCGEVVLTPAVVADFGGDVLPAGWSVTPWVAGGTGTLDDGMLVLDGAKVGCDALLQSPRSLEIRATFASRPDQHAGFGTNFVDVPWVMFSTKWGRRLYGRTHLLNLEDTKLAGTWLGAPHLFRIDWNVLDIVFSIDGQRCVQLMVPVPGHMRALAANQRLGREPLRVEWIRVSPYAPTGRFTSRPFDAGSTVDWATAAWEADVPEGTSLALSVRTGDTSRPDGDWSTWRRLDASGASVAARSRYLQYRADLATTDRSRTPVLRRVELRYVPGPGSGSGPGSASSSGSTRGAGFQ
jgi:hypothetical protein